VYQLFAFFPFRHHGGEGDHSAATLTVNPARFTDNHHRSQSVDGELFGQTGRHFAVVAIGTAPLSYLIGRRERPR